MSPDIEVVVSISGSQLLYNDIASTSQPLNIFEIQDNNGNCHPAQAAIVNQHELTVSKQEPPKLLRLFMLGQSTKYS